MPFHTQLIVQRVNAGTWRLMATLMYRGQEETFLVPAGYVTDFASVPAFLVWVVNKTGPFTLAAVVHDYLITDVLPAGEISSRDVDGIFRRIMREEGVPFCPRWLMWGAVRLASLSSPSRREAGGFVRDLPRLLLVLLPGLLLVPAALLVLVTRALLRLLRF